jgi:hypothetical protein
MEKRLSVYHARRFFSALLKYFFRGGFFGGGVSCSVYPKRQKSQQRNQAQARHTGDYYFCNGAFFLPIGPAAFFHVSQYCPYQKVINLFNNPAGYGTALLQTRETPLSQ